ncbi:MAG TPA: RebB family R body protein [Thermoanaerobaculia bacterium]|nr:RebB family R body protein [Thermoanaerobaculia bacterium]
MADPTLVNGQITDAVTQANVKVLGDAPAQAMGTLYQVMSHSVGIGMQNATSAQQNLTTLSAAATTQGVNLLYSMDPAAAAVSTQQILTGNSLAQELAQLNATLVSMRQNGSTAQS